MLGLSFGEPFLLLFVLALLPLWWLGRLEAGRRRAGDEAYGGASELRLGRQPRRQQLGVWMLAAAVLLLVITLSRPQWGSEEAPGERRGIDIAIALDVSRSMTATDVSPSRAIAAAVGVGDFLTHLRSDRVGLVIFSGGAFERSPLTLDLETLGQLVNQAQRDSELVGRGTDLGGGIDDALALLDIPDAAESQLIIVVSDGEDLDAEALSAAARASDAGISIFTVAVGTDAGASIPGDSAEIPVSRADRETLRAIATATGGGFRELDSIAGLAIEVQRLRQSSFGEDTGQQPIERFQWFLVPALVLLLLPLVLGEVAGPRARRHLGALALLGTLVLGACSGSQLYRHVEDGNEAYDLSFYDEALIDYRDALLAEPGEPAVGYNVGNTLHQLRRFEEAAVASADALGRAEGDELVVSIQYALGNHAVERGALEAARRYYINVLRVDPSDLDAKANLEFVLAQLSPPPTFEDPPPKQTPPADDTPTAGDDVPGGSTGDVPGDGEPPEDDEPGPDPGEVDEPTDTPGETPLEGDSSDDSGEPEDGSGSGGAGAPSVTLTLEQAQAALAQALEQLSTELTLEEAVELLALIRELNEVEPLDPVRPSGGGFDDR